MNSFLLDVSIFNFESSDALWTLAGVIIGALLTGGINYLLQKGQFEHNKEMYYLQNMSKKKTLEYLTELLQHKRYPKRAFSTLRDRIGAYSEEELRRFLIELDAVKTNVNGEEHWHLKSRESELKNPPKRGYM